MMSGKFFWIAAGLLVALFAAWFVRRVRLRLREHLFSEARTRIDARQFEGALAALDALRRSRYRVAEVELQRGIALAALKRHPEAIEIFGRLIDAEPRNAEAWYRRGNSHLQMQSHDLAVADYQQAVTLDPSHADAFYNCGIALQALRRTTDAIASYDRALALRPDDVEAYNNRGNAFLELQRPADAVASYGEAIKLDPRLADAQFNYAIALQQLGFPKKASRAYKRVRKLQPEHPEALGRMVHARMLCCDWRGYDGLRRRLDSDVRQWLVTANLFGYLASAESPADLQRAAQRMARDFRVPAQQQLPAVPPYRHERIRLGYLSGEFRHQATSLLMIDLFERHDRTRFELYAFDMGFSDGSDIRKRIDAAFDEVVDVSRLSDVDAAAEIRKREIDILVDLNGYFGLARPGILAHRPSMVQVNYLGFPGTLGTTDMDYLLADATVIPPEEQGSYDERVVYLPDSYQANDSRRPAPDVTGTREEAGLPAEGFVFCCFNNNFKITPVVFEVWMRLLKKVEGSVLWLLEDNADAASNLRFTAKRLGVEEERLVFAPRVSRDEHLARHRFADLFLDTLPCNAHTTASDALWAGLPLLTCLGTTFSGRVAASLLVAVGMPELVTRRLEEYERKALELAMAPEQLRQLRDRLATQKSSSPLFDTARMVRHVDAAFIGMWERHQRGEAPQSFWVAPIET